MQINHLFVARIVTFCVIYPEFIIQSIWINSSTYSSLTRDIQEKYFPLIRLELGIKDSNIILITKLNDKSHYFLYSHRGIRPHN